MSKAKEKDQDDDANAGYAWERQYERSWDALVEDERTGALRQLDGRLGEQRKRKKRISEVSTVVRRGMIRYLFLIVDLSMAVLSTSAELKPNRHALLLSITTSFVREYFDQNPLSQLGIIVTRNGVAEKLRELSGNPLQHVKALQDAFRLPSGESSLQNALDVACSSLRQIPSYGSREAVVIYSSLSTCDPGDIHKTIDALVEERVRCSAIGLSAEMYVLRKLAEKTGGQYGVPLHEDHLKELVFNHASPPPSTSVNGGNGAQLPASMMRMCFPMKRSDLQAAVSLCVCHQQLRPGGFVCPRCLGKYCEIPTDCLICGLTLVSSPHLARSYHHLFPVPMFEEVESLSKKNENKRRLRISSSSSSIMKKDEEESEDDDFGAMSIDSGSAVVPGSSKHVQCLSCMKSIVAESSLVLSCPSCDSLFCADCDEFIHSSLHVCPGCESKISAPPVSGVRTPLKKSKNPNIAQKDRKYIG